MTQKFGDLSFLVILLLMSTGISILLPLAFSKLMEVLPEPMRETLLRDLFQVESPGQKPQLNYALICRKAFYVLILFVVLYPLFLLIRALF